MILALDTSTAACSAALFDGSGACVASADELIGRGHAERLVPMIAELPGKGRADEIRVSLGPGSFTGTRIGLATGGALAIAWGSKVRGYPTLALVAAMARTFHDEPVSICMTGGHGEWFLQDFDADGRPETKLASVPLDDVDKGWNHRMIAGSKAKEKAAFGGPGHIVLDILPDARFALDIPETLLTERLAPLYGRPPDAKLPA